MNIIEVKEPEYYVCGCGKIVDYTDSECLCEESNE